MDQAVTPNRLHNRPPVREILAEHNDYLPVYLEDENRDLTNRCNDLLAAVKRIPVTVDDDETAGRVGDQVKQVAAAIKLAEARRKSDKEPALAAGGTVDNFYKTITDPLAKAKKDIEARLSAYLRKKAEEERRRREEEDRKAREAAEQAAREAAERAEALKEDSDLDGAIEAEERASEAQAAAAKAHREAEAKSAELSRSRGDYGSVASLRTFWTFDSLDRDKLDLEALRHHLPEAALEQAVRSFIKAGGRKLRGVHIFEDTSTVVR